jgi:tetratricopeptide (TPR) repeat protein
MRLEELMSLKRRSLAILLCGGMLCALPGWTGAKPSEVKLKLKQVDRAPAEGRKAPTADQLKQLGQAVADKPKDRGARFSLVMGLINAGKLDAALAAAKAWRKQDAYNLVVVRLIGDIYTELKRFNEARRSYSAVVELLPQDAGAQRALAAVLKQSGQLKPAYQRLVAAAAIRTEDTRIAFELADVAQRLGRTAEATRRFSAIINSDKTPAKIRYPAKQRLAQIHAAARLQALKRKDTNEAARLAQAIGALAIKGGAVNHIKVYLTWDTDRTDVDLWVINPAGQKVFYKHKKGKFGGALYDDVTDGYGPESFTASAARSGTYLVKVNYYGTNRRAFTEARGEVVVILNEGTSREQRHTLPYRLFKPKQTVTVARIDVRG